MGPFTFRGLPLTDYGFAPSEVRTWWSDHSCNTSPLVSIDPCRRAADTYGIVGDPLIWGTAPAEVQQWWTANGCTTQQPRAQDTCQHLSDLYGISKADPGWAPATVQDWYAAHGCHTSVITTGTGCQVMSDLFGTRYSVITMPWGTVRRTNFAAAPSDARAFWTKYSCQSSPRSFNDCQRASDYFAMSSGDPGFAPAEVQTWWNSTGCYTSPRRNMCQEVSNRYGIYNIVGIEENAGAAPPDILGWFKNHCYGFRPVDAAPIPG
jgi:hypothetical protein